MKTFVEPGRKAPSKSSTFFRSSKNDETRQPFFQAKLTVGPVDDQYEREADTVADNVMRMGKEEIIQPKISSMGVQRKCAKCEEEEKRQLQKKSSNKSIQRQETSTPDIPSPDVTLPKPSFLQPSSEPDFLAMKQPFFNRNVFQFWDPDSAMQVWRYNFDFFRGFGLSPDFSSSLSNFTAPRFIDSQLKADNPTWWEITDRELNTSTIMGSIPLFQFNSDFSLAPPSWFSTVFGEGEISVQRKFAACEAEEQSLKRKEKSSDNFNEPDQTEHYINSLDSNGKSLSPGEREFYESRFGYDFSNVQIHNDSIAAKSAESLNALAYTTGNHIVFNKGQYSPGTESGKRLMAHELTHVVQQSSGIQTKKIQRRVIDANVITTNAMLTALGMTRQDVIDAIVAADAAAIILAQNAENSLTTQLDNARNGNPVDANEEQILNEELGLSFNNPAQRGLVRQQIRRFRTVRETLESGYLRYMALGIGTVSLVGCEPEPCGTEFASSCPGNRLILLCQRFWTPPDQQTETILHEPFHIWFDMASHAQNALRRADASCFESYALRVSRQAAPASCVGHTGG